MTRPAWVIWPAVLLVACGPSSSPTPGAPSAQSRPLLPVDTMAGGDEGPPDQAPAGGPATATAPPTALAPTGAPRSAPSPPAPSAPAPSAPELVAIEPLASSKFLSPRDLELFNSFCQLAETATGVGCRCCPDQPAARWCVDEPGDPFTTVEHVLYGPFSRPGATEAFATGQGYPCGNLSAWGVSWFLRQEGSRWSLVAGEGYAHHVLHATGWDLSDGRRAIVTHDVIGKSFYEAIAFITLAADGKQTRTTLLEWTNSSCIMRVPGYYHAVARYAGANTYDHDRDGTRDLVVTLVVKRRFADDTFQADCAAQFEQHGGKSPFDRGQETKHVIPLLFDGAKLTAEPTAYRSFERAIAVVDKQGKPFEP